ncbi:hypothetical protein D9615_003322 [Tricholomella constricta]|uniref:Uncharacterized protein n=1 Tax=Tricholomella constricta TaxID=117010 RepID=A0A8H5HJB1_9AGAR|nr:hypothetical protein D9615_003322 [Tricholomella constricta]
MYVLGFSEMFKKPSPMGLASSSLPSIPSLGKSPYTLHLDMITPDDLPWPELGNVSRGATRGNQGQKGVLGPPDRDGRCILQLRVQPGVLAVRLNRQASDWYRALDTEVNRALKLTKTYWRKARRRQDYDARADQDHMELHEWLQQLKDKTMSHLELLMQKGDIQGPPYVMPDDIELTFLRKFIERQASGIPHNPRLRNSPGGHTYPPRDHSTGDSLTPEPSDSSFVDQSHRSIHDRLSDGSSQRNSQSPSLRTTESLSHEASSSKQGLQAARNALSRAQKDTQDAFMRYTACLDVERQARHAVTAAEKRRDDIMGVLLSQNQPVIESRSRHSSFPAEERRSPSRYHTEDVRNPTDAFSHPRVSAKLDWNGDVQGVYGSESTTHLEDHAARSRKHLRTWDQSGQMNDSQYTCEVYSIRSPASQLSLATHLQDITALPPRKRLHHIMPGFEVMNNAALHTANIGIQQ